MSDSYSFLSEIVTSDQVGSLDIRAYTSKIKDDLTRLESQCLQDYLVVSKDVESLQDEIDRQLAMLDKIEGVVDNFQTQIHDVSKHV